MPTTPGMCVVGLEGNSPDWPSPLRILPGLETAQPHPTARVRKGEGEGASVGAAMR